MIDELRHECQEDIKEATKNEDEALAQHASLMQKLSNVKQTNEKISADAAATFSEQEKKQGEQDKARETLLAKDHGSTKECPTDGSGGGYCKNKQLLVDKKSECTGPNGVVTMFN